jgi:transposase
MRLHANAALSLNGRRRMVVAVVEQGRSIAEAALAAGVSGRTCSKWVARYRAEGDLGLLDRSSAPRRVHNRTEERTVQLLAALRRLRFTAPELADLLDMPCSTISAILKRQGMGKLGRLGLEPAIRYERARPGELIHIDVKKLGRIQGGAGKRITGGHGRNGRPSRTDAEGRRRNLRGWEAVHVAVDDATRLAYVEVLPDEKATTAIGFLRRAIAFYQRHGITVERLITDNGSPYRATIHAAACRALASATCAPAPTGHRPTAKQNASSAPCWPVGPTARSTAPQPNAPQPLTAGSGTTTITADTKPSADRHPSTG